MPPTQLGCYQRPPLLVQWSWTTYTSCRRNLPHVSFHLVDVDVGQRFPLSAIQGGGYLGDVLVGVPHRTYYHVAINYIPPPGYSLLWRHKPHELRQLLQGSK